MSEKTLQIVKTLIIAVAIIVGSLVLADAIRYAGNAINAGFTIVH